VLAVYPVAILAGGLATRLRPLTEKIPKVLLDVNGEPFLAHQLRLLRDNGIEHVVICTGYLGHLVEEFAGNGSRFGLRVEYVADGPKLLGTAGCLRRALPRLGERFFVTYGDSYLPCDMRAVQATFDAAGKRALMTVYPNGDRWDRSNVFFRDGRLIDYNKKAPTSDMKHIDYGLGLFERRAFDRVPAGVFADLADLYRDLLRAGEVVGHEVPERFWEIGSFQGLEELCRFLSSKPQQLSA
jgi:NDP-sugar pyrophosphorylase family protein